jgi:hypothetical protein
MMTAKVGQFEVEVEGNTVTVHDFVTGDYYVQTVPIYSTNEPDAYKTFEAYCRRAGDGFRVGLGAFDDFDVVYLYDARPAFDTTGEGDVQGGNFGYAMNLQWPDGSEWGYAPFPVEGTDPAVEARAQAEMIAAFAGLPADDETIGKLMRGEAVEGVSVIDPMPLRYAVKGETR